MSADKFSPAPWVMAGRWGRVGVEIQDKEGRSIAIVNRTDAAYDGWLKANPPPEPGAPNYKPLHEQHVKALQRIDANVQSAYANAALVLQSPRLLALVRAALEVIDDEDLELATSIGLDSWVIEAREAIDSVDEMTRAALSGGES